MPNIQISAHILSILPHLLIWCNILYNPNGAQLAKILFPSPILIKAFDCHSLIFSVTLWTLLERG